MTVTPEDAAFRAEVRAFLADKLTPAIRAAGSRMTSVYADHTAQMAWQAILHERGWAAPAWPREYGGAGWSVTQRHIFERERVLAGAPPTSPMGINMAGPAIIRFGTEEQKSFFLPRMLSGEHFWCQGYSEPGAGSDLASLQMRAEREPALAEAGGDHLVCTGSKIWITHANVANWMFCLVRTSRGDRKQQGITFLLIDMTTPGIEVRPIVMTSGEWIQNQVFFDNVRVPIANVLGEIDQGWRVAKYLLEFERGGSAYAPQLQVRLDALREQAGPIAEEALFAIKLSDLAIQIEVLDALESDSLATLSRGNDLGADPSIMKILGTELAGRLSELELEAAGPLGRAWQPGVTRPGGPILGYPGDRGSESSGEPWQAIAPLRYLNARAGLIYAGTNEIQRGIIAKSALGL